MKTRREMKLGAVLFPTGAHVAAWRDLRATADGGARFDHFAEAARIAERGKLDLLFLADSASVRGPLNVARSAQARPLIFQAGSSEPGKELAAKTAEVVFTAQTTLAGAQAFYTDVKGRLGRYGRRPEDVLIMPGLHPIIGATEAEAQRKAAGFNDLIHVEIAVALLSVIMGGFDFSPYDVDGPLPDDIPETNGPKSRQQMLIDRARKENLTIRQLATIASQSQGHGFMVGTVEQVADRLEQWFNEGGADGFILSSTLLPSSLEEIVSDLVPELQRRGLFRREYEGATLRENLGLPRPVSRYARDAEPA